MYGIKVFKDYIEVIEDTARNLLTNGVCIHHIRETREELSLLENELFTEPKFLDFVNNNTEPLNSTNVYFGKIIDNQIVVESEDIDTFLSKGIDIKQLYPTEKAAYNSTLGKLRNRQRRQNKKGI